MTAIILARSNNNDDDTHKILWDFEIQTDHRIPVRRPDKKKKKEKKKRKRKKSKNVKDIQVLRTCKKTQKKNKLCDGDSYCNWCASNSLQKFGKKTGRVGNRRINRDIQSTVLLRSVRILRKVLETRGDLLSF